MDSSHKKPSDALTPDEVVLQPDDYELPNHAAGWARAHLEKMKQPVKVTRRQMVFFGERGVPWNEVEKFYGVDRNTLMRYYKMDYDRGFANTNVALRNKMVELALAGNPTMLIWVGKQRLNQSDGGPSEDLEGNDLKKQSTEDLLALADKLLNPLRTTRKSQNNGNKT